MSLNLQTLIPNLNSNRYTLDSIYRCINETQDDEFLRYKLQDLIDLLNHLPPVADNQPANIQLEGSKLSVILHCIFVKLEAETEDHQAVYIAIIKCFYILNALTHKQAIQNVLNSNTLNALISLAISKLDQENINFTLIIEIINALGYLSYNYSLEENYNLSPDHLNVMIERIIGTNLEFSSISRTIFSLGFLASRNNLTNVISASTLDLFVRNLIEKINQEIEAQTALNTGTQREITIALADTILGLGYLAITKKLEGDLSELNSLLNIISKYHNRNVRGNIKEIIITAIGLGYLIKNNGALEIDLNLLNKLQTIIYKAVPFLDQADIANVIDAFGNMSQCQALMFSSKDFNILLEKLMIYHRIEPQDIVRTLLGLKNVILNDKLDSLINIKHLKALIFGLNAYNQIAPHYISDAILSLGWIAQKHYLTQGQFITQFLDELIKKFFNSRINIKNLVDLITGVALLCHNENLLIEIDIRAMNLILEILAQADNILPNQLSQIILSLGYFADANQLNEINNESLERIINKLQENAERSSEDIANIILGFGYLAKNNKSFNKNYITYLIKSLNNYNFQTKDIPNIVLGLGYLAENNMLEYEIHTYFIETLIQKLISIEEKDTIILKNVADIINGLSLLAQNNKLGQPIIENLYVLLKNCRENYVDSPKQIQDIIMGLSNLAKHNKISKNVDIEAINTYLIKFANFDEKIIRPQHISSTIFALGSINNATHLNNDVVNFLIHLIRDYSLNFTTQQTIKLLNGLSNIKYRETIQNSGMLNSLFKEGLACHYIHPSDVIFLLEAFVKLKYENLNNINDICFDNILNFFTIPLDKFAQTHIQSINSILDLLQIHDEAKFNLLNEKFESLKIQSANIQNYPLVFDVGALPLIFISYFSIQNYIDKELTDHQIQSTMALHFGYMVKDLTTDEVNQLITENSVTRFFLHFQFNELVHLVEILYNQGVYKSPHVIIKILEALFLRKLIQPHEINQIRDLQFYILDNSLQYHINCKKIFAVKKLNNYGNLIIKNEETLYAENLKCTTTEFREDSLISNIDNDGNPLEPNVNALYTAETIAILLRIKLRGFNDVHILAALSYYPEHFKESLQELIQSYLEMNFYNYNDSLIIPILIPGEPGHWIGIKVTINTNLQISFYDSLPNASHITEEFKTLVRTTVSEIFTDIENCSDTVYQGLEQNDAVSCGAYLVENMYQHISSNTTNLTILEPQDLSARGIRLHHLTLLHEDTDPGSQHHYNRQMQLMHLEHLNTEFSANFFEDADSSSALESSSDDDAQSSKEDNKEVETTGNDQTNTQRDNSFFNTKRNRDDDNSDNSKQPRLG